MNDPLDELLSFAERSYVRMKAEHLIKECLKKGDEQPLNDLLEELILAGGTSFGIMRDVLEAIHAIQSTLSQEGMDVRQDLVQAMREFGVQIPKLMSSDIVDNFRQMCSRSLGQDLKRAARNLELEDEFILDELCTEASEKVTLIARRLSLLKRLEESVQDWMDAMAYQTVHALPVRIDQDTPGYIMH
ncbi:MAG: hypothetical protein JXA97_08330 [Anaerolineales bacterium]|nr:hypothetical protein [Anaerolineales bacterium]